MIPRPSYINPANYTQQDAYAGAQVAPDPDPIKTVCSEWNKLPLPDKESYQAWLKRHYFDPYVGDDMN